MFVHCGLQVLQRLIERGGVVVRASAWQLVGLGSFPFQVKPKEFKDWYSQSGVPIFVEHWGG